MSGGLPCTALVEAADRILRGDTGVNEPIKRAYTLYGEAAGAGSAVAAHRLSVLHATGIGQPADWARALAHLRDAARLGHPTAHRQLALIEECVSRGAAVVEAAVQDPTVVIAGGLVTPGMCRWIIESGRERLAPGQVNHIATGAPTSDPMRTAEAAPFQFFDMDVVLSLTLARIAHATGLAVYQYEPANLLHYAPGQQYKPHFDFINPGVRGFQEQLAIFGQRIATALVYLNDDFDGGETSFPALGFKFRGRPGDAIVFFNVDRHGQPHRASLHAGLPPSRGEKWVLSIWIRDRVQPIL